MTSLTGIGRIDSSETNTVIFTRHLYPVEPVAIAPCTERTPNTFTHSACEFGLVIHLFQTFNYDQFLTRNRFFGGFIHILLQGSASLLLFLASVFLVLDSFDLLFDLSSKLLSVGQARQSVDPCVNSYNFAFICFLACFNLKTELDVVLSDNI